MLARCTRAQRCYSPHTRYPRYVHSVWRVDVAPSCVGHVVLQAPERTPCPAATSLSESLVRLRGSACHHTTRPSSLRERALVPTARRPAAQQTSASAPAQQLPQIPRPTACLLLASSRLLSPARTTGHSRGGAASSQLGNFACCSPGTLSRVASRVPSTCVCCHPWRCARRLGTRHALGDSQAPSHRVLGSHFSLTWGQSCPRCSDTRYHRSQSLRHRWSRHRLRVLRLRCVYATRHRQRGGFIVQIQQPHVRPLSQRLGVRSSGCLA